MLCPLCNNSDATFYSKDKRRDYFQCQNCALVFVPVEQRLSSLEEKAEYDKHENNPNDTGYRNFLSRLHSPVEEFIKEHSKGLDFGCGPGPTLSVMFEENGHQVDNYDIFYADNKDIFNKRYDFITSSEVFEHLFKPGDVFEQIISILKPGGVLGVMTKRVTSKTAFDNWHYKNDKTHVCFFSDKTFEWLADNYNLKLDIIGNDVVLLIKGTD